MSVMIYRNNWETVTHMMETLACSEAHWSPVLYVLNSRLFTEAALPQLCNLGVEGLRPLSQL